MSDYLNLSPITRFLVTHGDNFSMVKSLIMFLPGRYSDSELISEALYSLVNLVQLFIDYESAYVLLAVNTDKTSKGEIIPPPYYLPTLKWINIIQNIEILLEVFASKKLPKLGRKLTIFFIELIKALLRVKLLIKNNGNMLVHHSINIPTNDVNNVLKSLNNNNKGNNSTSTLQTSDNNFINGKRKTLMDDITDEQQQQQQQQDHHQQNGHSTIEQTTLHLLPPYPPKDPMTKVIGELLSIFRPVIYWITRCICDKRSWKPWFISLFIELLSGSFSEYGQNTLNIPTSQLEKIELNRRKGLLLYYLIRKPFYDKFIGDGFVVRILNYFKKIPLLKILIDVLLNYLSAMRTRYFYTSTS